MREKNLSYKNKEDLKTLLETKSITEISSESDVSYHAVYYYAKKFELIEIKDR